eukprot:Protomagalhaensia_wolfi_Nauph_80__1221@NODE_171_length_3318_cov_170_090271_g123_i1_p4_GENE_NODE_171_length_3318_cov_170_090271_g123_i1NODE_171_length_3318_cov_170_090271_g123_i1_p4_ORF_typecomplete_len192_score17_70Isy1/PF06246_12/2_8e58Cbl_N2/PF02761_14/0_35Cbl_N2/PF02761_14/3_7e03DivIC/PF04977_15/0_12DivIC/PF04977_15/5_1e02YscO/PF07321_12/0_072YscO/PF07321_12/2e03_NODE_171_length_3318_cov_170_090271_g123_i110261601
MARNSERAMLLLNRWQEMKMALTRGPRRRRPRNADEISNAKDAEFWRNNIIREISVKIAEIQNAALGETKLKELNSEINVLINEKRKWEDQIKALGGPDYSASSSLLESGSLVTGEGYRYFGAAKELSSVRETLQSQQAVTQFKTQLTRGDLAKRIDPSYYGWCDEDDTPGLLEEEAMEEQRWINKGQINQ